MRKHGLAIRRWAASAALALAALPGCDAPASMTALKPEGAPEVLQVFMDSRVEDGTAAISLAYGTHPDWPENDPAFPTGPDLPNVIVNNEQTIRIVVDELLQGSTLEIFACACSVGACASGDDYTDDPALCGDDTETEFVNETGMWLDADRTLDDGQVTRRDGVPDDAVLRDAIATIDCGNGNTWTSGAEEGYYIPSGNQFVSNILGVVLWDTVGPAIVLEPENLPTGSTCQISIDPSVTDKQGEPVVMPAFTFLTEPLAVLGTVPDPDATNITLNLLAVSATFSAPIDPTSVDGTSIVVEPAAGGPALAGTVSVSTDSGATVLFRPAGALAAATEYKVTVKAGIKETLGGTLAQDYVWNFTTRN